jgi:hypothetical protein
MFYIYEWQPRRETKLACGHTTSKGKAYKVMISVCQDDVACLPQAIKASLQAQQQAQQANPSLLYRLWHRCFGKKPTKSLPRVIEHRKASPERKVNPMSQVKRYTVKAQEGLHLDCGHFINAGEVLIVTSVYSCPQEGNWPLTVLMACLQVLQQQQADLQPKPVNKTDTTKNVYTYPNGYHQPHA